MSASLIDFCYTASLLVKTLSLPPPPERKPETSDDFLFSSWERSLLNSLFHIAELLDCT